MKWNFYDNNVCENNPIAVIVGNIRRMIFNF